MLHKTRVVIRFRAKKPSPQTTRNFALVCLWCGRTVGRSVYGHVITKFSRMGSLPHFLTHGAPRRASRARAPLKRPKFGPWQENDTRSGRRFACRLYPSHGPLRFITGHSRFALASAMRKTKRLRTVHW